jgi:hypothetical protein
MKVKIPVSDFFSQYQLTDCTTYYIYLMACRLQNGHKLDDGSGQVVHMTIIASKGSHWGASHWSNEQCDMYRVIGYGLTLRNLPQKMPFVIARIH